MTARNALRAPRRVTTSRGLLFAALCMGLELTAATARGDEAPVSYVFIVANNQSFDGSAAPLHFADDDAARYAELFGLSARQVDLYTVLDADTQRLFPELVGRTLPPRRDAVLAGLQKMFAAIRRDVQAGQKVAFYFIYSGHGGLFPSGEGYVHLLDGPFSRSDLFEHVIDASPATVNHIIIDACDAYYLVAGRGAQAKPSGDYSDLIRSFVAGQRLQAHPNTGVVLSTTRAAEVHEWGRIEAGVFSHELRSALAGAADANGDGAITYGEVAAFLAAANGAITDPKARINAYVHAPAADLLEPLAYVPLRAATVSIPRSWHGRYYLEDDRGVRYADFNKAADYTVTMHLVPRPSYYLHSRTAEYLIAPATVGHATRVAQLTPQPVMVASRGSDTDQLQRYLFAIPFGPQFVAGFHQAEMLPAAQVDTAVVSPSVPATRIVQWSSAALGIGLGVAAGVFEALSQTTAAQYRGAAGSPTDVQALRSQALNQHSTAEVLGGLALTSGLVAVGTYVYDKLVP